ncbi:MAG: monofunctional biosynthetic peptidoglycan transglycosylase [Saprospiraceae bacterium]|jgi:monofunctional biosynthetic peptidoglycan transglycosylase
MSALNPFNIPIIRHRPKQGRVRWKRLLKWVVIAVVTSTVALLLPLRWIDPPTSSYIMRYEKAAKRTARHQWVDLEKMAWSMPLAAIAAEDQRFPSHWGLDVRQIHYALKNNTSRRIPLGASTITQQTIKNLYLWPSRSLFRKGLEAWLSVWLEILLPKKRIIEIYLNIAQFGKSVFGVGVASQHYFGKDVSELTAYQASLLAASLPTPSSSNPAKPSAYLKTRGRALLKQMRQLGWRNVIIKL